MLSSALSQVLDRARTRFGLEVEILDGDLRNLYPETGTELGRLVGQSPELRQSLRDALVGGHPRDVEGGGQRYRVYPLRNSERLGRKGGLLAVRGRDDWSAGQAGTGPSSPARPSRSTSPPGMRSSRSASGRAGCSQSCVSCATSSKPRTRPT